MLSFACVCTLAQLNVNASSCRLHVNFEIGDILALFLHRKHAFIFNVQQQIATQLCTKLGFFKNHSTGLLRALKTTRPPFLVVYFQAEFHKANYSVNLVI